MNGQVSGLTSLRHATHDLHTALDSELKIAMPAAGKPDYQLFIEAMWGWLVPFENALWQAEWPTEMQADSRNNKRAWLHSDLLSAGLQDEDIAALPLAPCELDLSTPASRFGIAYVLEGAQLGSQVLSKRLKPTLQPWPARWLTGYGDDVGQNWRTFMQSANAFLSDDEQSRIAAQSARQTFASLRSWFQQRGAA